MFLSFAAAPNAPAEPTASTRSARPNPRPELVPEPAPAFFRLSSLAPALPIAAKSTARSSEHPGPENFDFKNRANIDAETSRSGSKNRRVCASATSLSAANASASKSCSLRTKRDARA